MQHPAFGINSLTLSVSLIHILIFHIQLAIGCVVSRALSHSAVTRLMLLAFILFLCLLNFCETEERISMLYIPTRGV